MYQRQMCVQHTAHITIQIATTLPAYTDIRAMDRYTQLKRFRGTVENRNEKNLSNLKMCS